jgi:hypothetical protein
MDTARPVNRNVEAIAWGVFFVWWGITELVPSMPDGIGAIGIGLIFLGLNAARSMAGLPTSSLTLTLGFLALVLGGLELSELLLGLPYELPIFAVLLMVLGGLLLVREAGRRTPG